MGPDRSDFGISATSDVLITATKDSKTFFYKIMFVRNTHVVSKRVGSSGKPCWCWNDKDYNFPDFEAHDLSGFSRLILKSPRI